MSENKGADRCTQIPRTYIQILKNNFFEVLHFVRSVSLGSMEWQHLLLASTAHRRGQKDICALTKILSPRGGHACNKQVGTLWHHFRLPVHKILTGWYTNMLSGTGQHVPGCVVPDPSENNNDDDVPWRPGDARR